MTALLFIAVAAIGYVLGSIPFGLFIGRLFVKKDIRQEGSGKIGMTNVLRTAGRKAAVISLLLDIAKGALAVGIAALIFHDQKEIAARIFTPMESAKVLAALAAVAGHTWSVFLKFKGGRGVATFFGALLALYWPAAVVGALFVFGIGFFTKYMSLGSIIGAITAFIILMSFYIAQVHVFGPHPPFEYVVYAMAGAVFIYVMHRDNILRLYNGTERRIGDKSKSTTVTNTNSPK